MIFPGTKEKRELLAHQREEAMSPTASLMSPACKSWDLIVTGGLKQA